MAPIATAGWPGPHTSDSPAMTRGQLTVLCGPTFAGKSTALLERTARAQAQGLSANLLKPGFDTRHGASRVTTHDGRSLPATPLAAMPVLGSPAIPHGTAVVLLDEVQFMEAPQFGGGVIAGVHALLLAGIEVVAAGLDMDWQGHPFRVTGLLCAMATTVTSCGPVAPYAACRPA